MRSCLVLCLLSVVYQYVHCSTSRVFLSWEMGAREQQASSDARASHGHTGCDTFQIPFSTLMIAWKIVLSPVEFALT